MTASQPASLRVGFVGAGANTRLRHLPGFAAITAVDLAAVANRSLESAQVVAARCGIKNARANWREVVADPGIDAVCIGTWPDTHAEITGAALAAGKHVLVEARMASSLPEARAMRDAARNRPELVAQIVPSPFTLEADRIIRDLVNDGTLGDVRLIESEFRSGATLDPTAPLHWRMDERISGVNVMALGICYEPLQRWFVGKEAEVEAARAEIMTPLRKTETGEIRSIVIPEKLEVHGSLGKARLVMRQSSVEPGAAVCRYRISGTEAEIDYDANARRLVLKRDNSSAAEITLPTLPRAGWAVERQFVDSIRAGSPVTLTDFDSGVRYMRFTDAVWRALQP